MQEVCEGSGLVIVVNDIFLNDELDFLDLLSIPMGTMNDA
jgi:hypothetical protein